MVENSQKIETHKLCEKGTKMAVTINPPPQMQYFFKGKKGSIEWSYAERRLAFVKYWKPLFKRLDGVATYSFYLEISPYGLLHWHGTCTVIKPQQFRHWLGVIRYGIGVVGMDVDPVSKPEIWDKYVKKDSHQMKCHIDEKAPAGNTILDHLAVPQDNNSNNMSIFEVGDGHGAQEE